MKRFKLILLLLFCVSLPLHALATLPDQIKNDFSPLAGTIIMPIGDQFLVDLDASSGLQEGDILTLVTKGEQVIQPVTGELLGALDVVRGYLQVTQVKSGYSYAEIISSQTPPQKGDQVKRFEQVPAEFKTTAEDTILASELKIGLPHLAWVDKQSSQQPLLTFSLVDNQLLVKNEVQVTLKSYQYTDGQLSAPLGTLYQPDSFTIGAEMQKSKTALNQGLDNLLGVVGFSNKDKRLENPGIISSKQQNGNVLIGSNLDGNPVGLAIADFDGDGMNETAIAMEDQLQIHRMIDGNLKLIAKIEFGNGVHLLNLDAIDLDQNGLPELYLSANVGTDLSSQVVEFKDREYRITQNQIPWYLRVVNLPKEGPILIAQAPGVQNTPFYGNPFRVVYSADKLKRGSDLALPNRINFFGFIPIQGTNNDLLYASLNANDYLSILTKKNTELWTSSEHLGGTEVFFYNHEKVADELIQPVYIQQRLLQLSSGEILVPRNEGPRALKRFRNFTENNIIAMKWDGYAMTESWCTAGQNGYLADFTLADADNDGDDELVMVIKYSQKNIIQKGRSAVVIYELNQ